MQNSFNCTLNGCSLLCINYTSISWFFKSQPDNKDEKTVKYISTHLTLSVELAPTFPPRERANLTLPWECHHFSFLRSFGHWQVVLYCLFLVTNGIFMFFWTFASCQGMSRFVRVLRYHEERRDAGCAFVRTCSTCDTTYSVRGQMKPINPLLQTSTPSLSRFLSPPLYFYFLATGNS